MKDIQIKERIMKVIDKIRGRTVSWGDRPDGGSDGAREIFVDGQFMGRAKTAEIALEVADLWISIYLPDAGKPGTRKKDASSQDGWGDGDYESDFV
jgi:hypothetical protein